MLFIDSDNGMGSRGGDVDDAFAIAALLRARRDVAGIASVGGNTTEPRAAANIEMLARLLGFGGPLLRGAPCRSRKATEASAFLAASRAEPMRVAAFGPLTNVATALRGGARASSISELLVVGGNLSSRGTWPPIWPREFNITKDLPAALEVFASELPLTLFPLDVARTLWIERRDLDAIAEPFGSYARKHCARWFRHLRIVKWSGHLPVWDLAAAMYLIAPELYTIDDVRGSMHANGWIDVHRGMRALRICRALDRKRVWERFVALMT